MSFRFETLYNLKSLTAMAKALRKTVRKKKSKRSHIFGWIVLIPAILLGASGLLSSDTLSFNIVLTFAAAIVILFTLISEDSLNAFFAKKRMLKGTERVNSVFDEKNFYSQTSVGKSEWNYDKIIALAETKDYFIFVFDMSHAQVYDKNTLVGGTAEEFKEFICNITKTEVVKV